MNIEAYATNRGILKKTRQKKKAASEMYILRELSEQLFDMEKRKVRHGAAHKKTGFMPVKKSAKRAGISRSVRYTAQRFRALLAAL